MPSKNISTKLRWLMPFVFIVLAACGEGGDNPELIDTDVDTDNDGLIDQVDPDDDGDGVLDVDDTFPLDASRSNALPVISLNKNKILVSVGASFDLGVTATDIEGDELTYVWRVNEQAYQMKDVIDLSLPIGDYQAIVTVSDSFNTVSATVNISVLNKQPPSARVNGYQEVGSSSQVTLIGSDSFDLDGSIASYFWSQPNDQKIVLIHPEAAEASFTAPDTQGIFTFTLTVMDEDGLTASSHVWVNVCDVNGCGKIETLNDTGVITCSNDLLNGLACPEVEFEGQDGESGRDLDHALTKVGAGKAGFDFTKLDIDGHVLDASAQEWSCVLDNHTGFVWEVKSVDGSLHDSSFKYSWYSTDNTNNNGDKGTANGGNCLGSDCDTQSLVMAVNANALCGFDDWQLPNKAQLQSIVDYGIYGPSIDIEYFPNTVSNYYWSSSASAGDTNKAWNVGFNYGSDSSFNKSVNLPVRLVRVGQ